MKYVITGGAGFIGSNIAKLLLKEGHQIIIIDNLHTGNLSRLENIKDEIIFHKIDIRDYEKMKDVITGINGIFHQAALTVVSESFLNPEEYFDVNVNGTKNIFKIAKELDVKVVFASSSSVYGDVKNVPIKENDDKNPINPYGKTKLEKEHLAGKKWEEGVKIIGLRYFNVYGKGQTGTYAGVITQFMKKLSNNLSPIIHGKGNQIRDFISVEDVAKANLLSMESNTDFSFLNIGTGISTSVKTLAEVMIELSGKTLEISYDDLPLGDVKESLADTSLAKKLINSFARDTSAKLSFTSPKGRSS